MPIFFLISGFLFYDNELSIEKVKQKIKSRISTILIPYIFWSSLAYVYFAVLTHIPLISNRMAMEVVPLNILEIVKGITLSSYAPMWYLRVLLLLCILCGLLFILVRNTVLIRLLMIGIILFNAFFGYKYVSIFTWMPFFLCGMLLREYRINKFNRAILLAIGVVFVIISYCLAETTCGIFLYFFRFFFAVSIVSKFIDLECKTKWYYGAGMFIYGAHFMIVSAIEKLAFILLGTNMYIATIVFFMTPVTTIIILIIIANYMNRLMPGLWSVANGYRQLR